MGPLWAPLGAKSPKSEKKMIRGPSLGDPFGYLGAPLGRFWTLGTKQMRGFLEDPFVAHILWPFGAPLGGGAHAIRSRRRMHRKGRPFLKRVHSELHLDLILVAK